MRISRVLAALALIGSIPVGAQAPIFPQSKPGSYNGLAPLTAPCSNQPDGTCAPVDAAHPFTMTVLGAPFYMHPGYVAGRWYAMQATGTGTAGVNGSLRLTPFLVLQAVTVSDIGLKVITPSAGGNALLLIYGSNATTKMPQGAPIASSGNLSTAAAGMVTATLGAPVTLQPGLYWAGTEADNATVAFASLLQGGNPAPIGTATPASYGTGGGSTISYSVTATYGATPDLTAAPLTEGVVPYAAAPFLRIAGVL